MTLQQVCSHPLLVLFLSSGCMNGAMKAFEGGTFEALYYKKNGHAIWLQVEITPIRNEQAVVVLFLSTYRDITIFKAPKETPFLFFESILLVTRGQWPYIPASTRAV